MPSVQIPSGVPDEVLSVEDLLLSLAAEGTDIDIPAGEYDIDETLTISGPRRIRCSPGAVIRPAVADWDPLKPAVILTGTDLVIEGTLEIDGRGDERTAAETLFTAITCTDLDGFQIDHIRLRDVGVSTVLAPESVPTGPDLLFAAADTTTDLDTYSTGNDGPVEVGGCQNGWVGHIELIKDDAICEQFGVRFLSNYLAARDKDTFTHRVRNIRVDRITVDGSFEWNAVECAGGGTVDISLGEVTVDGKCLTALDFDKGCVRCTAERVLHVNGGKPTRYIGDGTKRLAAVHVHGVDGGYTTDDCYVGEVVVRDCTSASTDVHESGFACQYATNVRVGSVDVDGLNAGAYGRGVFVDQGVDHVHVGHLRTRTVAVAASVNSGVGCGDIAIETFDVEPVATTAFGFAPGAAGGRVRLGAGRIAPSGSLGSGVPHVSFGANLTSAHLGAATISGGGAVAQGVYAACSTTVVAAVIDSQNYGVVANNATARCIGVDTATCSNDTAETNGGSIVGAGNSWEDV